MKVEGWLFLGCGVFFAGTDVVYWYSSHDPTGTVAIAFAVGLAVLTGFYVLFTGRRLPRRPEDDNRGEIEQGTVQVHRRQLSHPRPGVEVRPVADEPRQHGVGVGKVGTRLLQPCGGAGILGHGAQCAYCPR